MQPVSLLRLTLRVAGRYRASCNPPSLQQCNRASKRPLCTSPTPAPKPETSATSTAEASKTQKPSPTESLNASAASSETAASKTADTVKSTEAAAPTATASEQTQAKFPDVPSTSLGIENPESSDPLKWKKFAYKYAGAVLLFMVSYKTLHWYVDRLEAEGKRKREEMEENKVIAQEIRSGGNVAPVGAPVASSAAPMGAAPHAAVEQVAQQEQTHAMRIFDPVKEEEPHLVSELEELYVYKVELETKLRDLRAEKWTREIDAKKRDVELELKELAKEIRDLEEKEVPFTERRIDAARDESSATQA